jgi:parvulin-like peptidyl-prolyl isomerase
LGVLAEIKAGANFGAMAAKYGSDGTKDRGGDLGWFGKGQMVKPFEAACFGASAPGLLPNLVETQFGYHIVRVDVAKMARKFFVASVNKPVVAYENTIDSVYKIADEFLSKVTDTATFNKEVKNYKNATPYSQPYVEKTTRALTAVTQAREIVNWLYNDERDLNDTKLFTVDNFYVVAIYTEERPKGTATVNSVRDQVKPRVLNELKADKIKEKLKTDGSLESIAKAYGKDAISNTTADLTFASGVITGVGYEPEAAGVAFGLTKGKRSQVIVGESGVLIIEKVGETPSTIADYNQFVKQIEQQRKNKMMYGAVEQALRFNVDIEDFRYRY